MGLFDNDKFFGLDLKTNDKEYSKQKLETFELESEGGVERRINPSIFDGGRSTYAYDMVTVPTDEIELLMKYRNLAKTAEIDIAIQEIKNEVFIFDELGKRPVSLSFIGNSKIPEKTKQTIIDEFINIYNILDFQNKGIEYFLDWYIDGKLFLQKVIDSSDTKKGIKKFVKVSPFNIKKIKEYQQSDSNGIFDMTKIKEYYVYSENSSYLNKKYKFNSLYGNRRNSSTDNGLLIKASAIAYIDSGIYDDITGNALSFLHKAIVPYNQLKMIEDAHIIYMVTRAPSRRIFYIDGGNMPTPKAEAKVKSMMEKMRTKLMYDPSTGSLVDKRNVLSIAEDIWLLRQNGRSTEVQELDAGDDQSTDYLEYLKNKLYHSVNVPYSRLSSDASLTYGKATEINRDELRMKKFINFLRQRFMFIFEDSLRTQLILKNVIKDDEWQDIKNDIQWTYTEDNNYVEWKEAEVLNSRMESANTAKDLIELGLMSNKKIMKDILKYSDEEIEDIKKDNENSTTLSTDE